MMDCEMVGIGFNGKQSARVWVSLMDWYGQVVPSRVTDFCTFVSRVTPMDISHGEPWKSQNVDKKLLKEHLSKDIQVTGNGRIARFAFH
jgi:hypothetical protein